MAVNDIDAFYHSLQTLPRLISDLALSVAEAQRRMDQNYIESLAQFTKIVKSMLEGNQSAQYLELFKAIAPSRYQFSETVIEVRADLQMTTATELGVSGSVGIKTPVVAVAVNASYAKRSAYDYQAAALIRTVLQAIPADPNVIAQLKDGASSVTLPDGSRYKALADAFKELPKLPAAPAPPGQ